MEILELMGVPYFKKGKGIHIKKKNRGKFTEYCGGKVTDECIKRAKKSKNPTLRKRATFAANARKWKHADGGIIKAQLGTMFLTPHPLSPVGIALNQAKANAKNKKDQTYLPPGVKEVVGPDGKKIAIRTEQPLKSLEQSIAEWLPGTGDVAEVGYIANDVKNGNLGSAALAAGLFLIPGNMRKILDTFGIDFGAIKSFFKLTDDIKLKPRKTKTTTSLFKDPFGREITPTPYPGPDSELINAVDEALLNVLRDYFSKSKINQIKTTMNWGDAEIAQLQDEILRAIGTKADVLIKGPTDGFTIIGEHSGRIKGTGSNAEGYHAVTLNRERMPNLQIAEEAGIHEIGVHGKTLSMKPENFGKGGYSDLMKEMFPMLAEITLKNAELASELLVPNKLGKYISLFKTSADLERYFDAHNIPWDKWDKFNNKRTYFNYVNAADEKTARAYTGLLYEKLHGPEYKTQNIEQLEQFFTPESVEQFKKAVLGVTPFISGLGATKIVSGNSTKNSKNETY